LTACYLKENRVDIDFSGFDNLHLLGEHATHLIRPPSGALAVLQILAIAGLWLRLLPKPARPMTTCSGASNYRF
jgi:hypothetical protein